MAAVVDRFSLSLDFSSEKLGPDILWYNPPQQYKLRCNGDTGLKVFSVRFSFHVACQILAVPVVRVPDFQTRTKWDVYKINENFFKWEN